MRATTQKRGPTDRRTSVLRLDATDRPAAAARRHTRATVSGWGLPDTLADTAELVVGELTANAERHGQRALRVRLTLCDGGAMLLVGVRDAAPSGALGVGAADDDAESGRGLALVDALSRTHGVRLTPCHKDVWATLPVPPALVPDSPVGPPTLMTRRLSRAVPTFARLCPLAAAAARSRA